MAGRVGKVVWGPELGKKSDFNQTSELCCKLVFSVLLSCLRVDPSFSPPLFREVNQNMFGCWLRCCVSFSHQASEAPADPTSSRRVVCAAGDHSFLMRSESENPGLLCLLWHYFPPRHQTEEPKSLLNAPNQTVTSHSALCSLSFLVCFHDNRCPVHQPPQAPAMHVHICHTGEAISLRINQFDCNLITLWTDFNDIRSVANMRYGIKLSN